LTVLLLPPVANSFGSNQREGSPQRLTRLMSNGQNPRLPLTTLEALEGDEAAEGRLLLVPFKLKSSRSSV
jgi:hypothetical protein